MLDRETIDFYAFEIVASDDGVNVVVKFNRNYCRCHRY